MSRRPLLGAFALLAPLLLLFVHTLQEPLPDVVVHGDLAIVELHTLKAAQLEQLHGPYSRFKVHHPGPALFYWLAPFYELGGRRFGALCLGMLVLNSAALILFLLVPWKLGGRAALILATPAAALLFLHAGPHVFWSVWNPEAGLLPLAAGVAAAFAVASGRPHFLAPGLFFSSFAAQCHVLFVLPAASAWLAALALAFWRRRQAAIPMRSFLFAVPVMAVFWLPVAAEEWKGEPGNLSLLLYLRSDPGRHTLGTAALEPGLAALSEALWSPFGYGGARRVEGQNEVQLAQGLSLGLLGLAATGIAVAWRRGSQLALSAFLILGGELAGCFFSLASLSGELHIYLTRFFVPIGPLIGLILACLFSSLQAKPAKTWLRVATGFAALLLVQASWRIVETPPLGLFLERSWGQEDSGPAAETVRLELDRLGIQAPYLGILDGGLWPYAAALVTQLEKRGRQVVIYEDWEFMFGRDHSRGPHDGLVLLGRERGDEPLPPSATVVSAPPLTATLIPMPEAFSAGGRSCLGVGDADSDLFLRSGFFDAEYSDQEAPSRWSRFDRSVLSVRLHPGQAYRFQFEASAHHATLPQEVQVIWNESELGRLAITEAGWRTYELEIPSAAVASLNEVSLTYSRTVLPSAVGLSNDHRVLALRYRSFCFEELPTTR